jgi:hypothetical protein
MLVWVLIAAWEIQPFSPVLNGRPERLQIVYILAHLLPKFFRYRFSRQLIINGQILDPIIVLLNIDNIQLENVLFEKAASSFAVRKKHNADAVLHALVPGPPVH